MPVVVPDHNFNEVSIYLFENINNMKQFIANGGDPNIVRLSDYSTILHEAVNQGNREMVELLLLNGVDINRKTIQCLTPLYLAVLQGNREMVKLLLLYKPDLDSKTLRCLTPLHEAVIQRNQEMVLMLLQNGADPNVLTITKTTALFTATVNGYLEIVKMLLGFGAVLTVRTRTRTGTSAYDIAKKSSPEIFEMFEWFNIVGDLKQYSREDAVKMFHWFRSVTVSKKLTFTQLERKYQMKIY